CLDRRNKLRGRDEEERLLVDELSIAAARRDEYALLRKHRGPWRRCNLLRTIRHRQDYFERRPRTTIDWRRRARLVRRWCVQFRGRLLRESNQAQRGSRAGHLPHHAHVRHDP